MTFLRLSASLKSRTTGIKKFKNLGVDGRRKLFDKTDRQFSQRKQCALLGLNWSTLRYKAVGTSPRDIRIMELLDQQYTATPFYGVLKMAKALNDAGFRIGKDHTRTLMRSMDLMAVYPKKNTSQPHPEHRIYPYLLRGMEIVRANQVWSADITYVRLTLPRNSYQSEWVNFKH